MRYKLFVGKFTVGAIWRESKSFQEIVKRVNLVIMGKGRKNFYAVRVGRSTGVYSTWDECESQVKGHPGAVYKGFSTHSEACNFVQGQGGYGGPSSGRGGGGGQSSGRTQPSYQPAQSSSYKSSGSKPSYSSSARQRYCGNFTSNRSYGSSRGYSGRTCKYYSGHSSLADGGGSLSSTSSRSSSRPVVYSDGCCYNNGFRGACGGIGVYWADESSYNVSEKLQGHQTNQRAELLSACRALETAIEQGHESVEVRTDSTYTIKAVTEWIGKWKANGWRTVSNEDVKNKEDIQRLDSLCQNINVKWTHVRGHAGVPGNEAADHLAKAGSQRCPV